MAQKDTSQGTFKSYSVPKDNYLPYVKAAVEGASQGNHVIMFDNGAKGFPDPAPGCSKDFFAKYKCGQDNTQYTLSVTAEAKGKNVNFDCGELEKKCKEFRLTLGTDGILVMKNESDKTSKDVWKLAIGTTRIGVPREKWSAKNGKYGRNYMKNNEFLGPEEFMGSENGNCYLIMTKNGSNKYELQLKYDIVSCPDDGNGTDPNAYKLSTIPNYPSTNIGKIGYVAEDGLLHRYPNSMISPGDDFDLVGKFTSIGNDLTHSNESSVDNCKSKCLSYKNNECGGFTYGVSAPKKNKPLKFRYVHVQYPLSGGGNHIQISQIVIMSDKVNVAKGGIATAPNQWENLSSPSKAIDGTAENRNHPNEYHSGRGPTTPADNYWDLDLKAEYDVDSLTYYNRNDCCSDRAQGMEISLLDENKKLVKTLVLTAEMVQTFDFINADVTPPDPNNCKLKTQNIFPAGNRQPNENYELYVRNKSLQNNLSCNKNYESVTLSTWGQYDRPESVGKEMTMDTLCNLAAFTAKDKEELAAKKRELDALAAQIKTGIKNLKDSDQKLAQELSSNMDKVQSNMGSYDKIQRKRQNFTDHVDKNVHAMAEDANLQMMSDMYRNILWSIVAVSIVLVAARLIRGMNNP